jgi:hypothetical protein
MFHALGGHLLQTILNGMIERRTNLYIEPSANEGQAKRFSRQLREFDTNPTENAFARFENHTRRLRKLLKGTPFPSKATGFGSVDLGVMLEQTVT